MILYGVCIHSIVETLELASELGNLGIRIKLCGCIHCTEL